MIERMLAVAVVLGVSQEPAAARHWFVGDPAVRFVEGTTSPPIETVGSWEGSVAISVRCTVATDGSLERCAVVQESRPGRLDHPSARRGVRRMRLVLGEDGPQPGDTLTVEAVVTRD